jgi:hypothetical protein
MEREMSVAVVTGRSECSRRGYNVKETPEVALIAAAIALICHHEGEPPPYFGKPILTSNHPSTFYVAKKVVDSMMISIK